MRQWGLLEVGKKYDNWKIGIDGTMVEFNNSTGLTLLVFYNTPTDYEMKQFKLNRKFEIKIKEINEVIFFVFKFGNMPYMDCAFNPNLLNEKVSFNYINDESMGLALNILIIDSFNGELRHIRTIGLGHKISNKFIEYCKKQESATFDKNKFNDIVERIQATYTSLELATLIEEENTFRII